METVFFCLLWQNFIIVFNSGWWNEICCKTAKYFSDYKITQRDIVGCVATLKKTFYNSRKSLWIFLPATNFHSSICFLALKQWLITNFEQTPFLYGCMQFFYLREIEIRELQTNELDHRKDFIINVYSSSFDSCCSIFSEVFRFIPSNYSAQSI